MRPRRTKALTNLFSIADNAKMEAITIDTLAGTTAENQGRFGARYHYDILQEKTQTPPLTFLPWRMHKGRTDGSTSAIHTYGEATPPTVRTPDVSAR
jgi:hypothetical protein